MQREGKEEKKGEGEKERETGREQVGIVGQRKRAAFFVRNSISCVFLACGMIQCLCVCVECGCMRCNKIEVAIAYHSQLCWPL